MSFDTNYPNRKDKRAPYRTTGRYDASCRPGGDCPYCRANRTFNVRKSDSSAAEQLAELHEGAPC